MAKDRQKERERRKRLSSFIRRKAMFYGAVGLVLGLLIGRP